MSGENWAIIIVGGLELIGVIITVIWGNKKNAKRSKEQTEVTLYRIGELEKKQEKYNCLQERVLERELHDAKYDERIEEMRGDIKQIKKKIFKEQ